MCFVVFIIHLLGWDFVWMVLGKNISNFQKAKVQNMGKGIRGSKRSKRKRNGQNPYFGTCKALGGTCGYTSSKFWFWATPPHVRGDIFTSLTS
ncbi:hypothetical protein LOK49_LG01G01096 [Camellia lanceoleosa]|uniref:Uncharacterized protein n=1 Tax=Camellia lanceoleosa TaxID=1840588 RepID=A0ACC0J1B0_9ERIC|nr:hypothetical protein LOK49_LG01G01096 [Camellia lanceoleosa]